MAPIRFAIRNRIALIALGIALLALLLGGWGIYIQKVANVQAQQAQSDGKQLADPLAALCTSDPSAAARIGQANCQKAAEVQQQPTPAAAPVPGPAGVGIASVIPGNCAIRIALTDGRVSTVSNLCGPPGTTGAAGKDAAPARGISSTARDGCSVDVTYTDDTTQTLGPFCGADGQDGKPGTNGTDGTTPPCMSTPAQCQGADGKTGPQGVGISEQHFVLNDSGDCVSRVTYTDPADGTTRVDDTPAGAAACPAATTPPTTTPDPPTN